jgi:uncharacterized protein (UPF0276 family)
VLASRPRVGWFEAISENYLGLRSGRDGSGGGPPLEALEAIRRDYPVVLHGVSLSVGSTDPLDRAYLKRLRQLADRIEPAWMSDHVCWTGVGGRSLHDLLPMPYTEAALRHLVPRIVRAQEALGRRLLFENVSSYLDFSHAEMTEWEFLAELAERADCGLLLDVNNVYVSAHNQGFDAREYLAGIPAGRVGQMHLAGHSRRGGLLVDTHDGPVSEPVLELYLEALGRFGDVPTLIEWDARLPDFARLEREAARVAVRVTEWVGAGVCGEGRSHAQARA